jgi:hypothetical protein
MSSEQKTIVINPELFNSSNKKKIKTGENNTTRKKEKKSKPIIPDNVPNSKTLRKQFIKKIKEKQAESEKQYKLLENQKDKEINKENNNFDNNKKILTNTNTSFNDEFTKSLAYLTALSESREKEKIKKKIQQNEQKKMNFTLKKERNLENTNNNYNFNNKLQEIQLELPDSLKPSLPEITLNNNNIFKHNNSNTFNKPISKVVNTPIITLPVNNNNNSNSNNNLIEVINIQTNQREIKEPPPYGCLKGGNKPTFKQWTQHNRTLKSNHNISDNNNNDINHDNYEKEKLKIQDFKQNEELSEREKRLQVLKDKYSFKHKKISTDEIQENNKKIKKYNYTRTIKKTTTVRNFKLGKNPKRKSISVLIKNGATRKKIKTEISELKRKGLSEIKEYLRSRNLLKIGSEAPPDVLRQMYETSILTGEINNLSSETLVHNFLNS